MRSMEESVLMYPGQLRCMHVLHLIQIAGDGWVIWCYTKSQRWCLCSRIMTDAGLQAQKCNDGAVGQVVCNRGGTVFCCNSVAGESCTTTPGQINICISNFTSPNSGISKDAAYSKYLAALGSSTITTTSQIITPSPFSTLNPSKTPTPSSTSTTSSFVSTPTSTFPSSTFLLTSPSLTPSSYGFSSSSATAAHIPQGAIAGIVVGVLAGLAILFGVIFVYRRQLQKRNQERNLHESSKENASTPLAYAENNEKVGLRNHAPSELDSERTSRVELPVSQNRGRFEMP